MRCHRVDYTDISRFPCALGFTDCRFWWILLDAVDPGFGLDPPVVNFQELCVDVFLCCSQ